MTTPDLNRAAVSQWTHAPVALPCPHAASSMRTTLLQRFMRPACQSDPLDTLLGSLTIRFGKFTVSMTCAITGWSNGSSRGRSAYRRI